MLTDEIWAVMPAAVGVGAAVDSVDAGWSLVLVVVPAGALSAGVADVAGAALLDARADRASGRVDVPALDAVDDAVIFFDEAVDLPAVSSADPDDDVLDPAVDLGPRAVWPVAFFVEPELDVAEFDEPDAELWSVSSALATATTGLAKDNPSARAAIPALAPR